MCDIVKDRSVQKEMASMVAYSYVVLKKCKCRFDMN